MFMVARSGRRWLASIFARSFRMLLGERYALAGNGVLFMRPVCWQEKGRHIYVE